MLSASSRLLAWKMDGSQKVDSCGWDVEEEEEGEEKKEKVKIEEEAEEEE